ncbi:MAG: protein kinase [Moorea sp. SIO2B7]|nr:protein kinase [Moorena sp. SIO2B7]
MSYCLNPDCPKPRNPDNTKICKSCGSKLLLRDRYLVIKTLGQGGFGATFLARNLSLPGKPPCVIKQLRPTINTPNVFPMARELFEREAQTLGRIGNHPQVPTLLDYFEDNQQFYLVQEYVKGHNLQQEVKRNGSFSEAGVRQFLSEIMPMINYIHSQQVIHRDIKPANLIRREQDRKLVLIDFGAVKNRVKPNSATNNSEQTALTAFAVGTPGFAPPEQMAMRPVYASDIYAVGVTCIYLLTAKSPKDLDYNPTTGEMVWQKYVNISSHLAQVLAKMLEVSVRHRYQTADQVLNALDLEPYLDSLEQGLITTSNTGLASGNLLSSGRKGVSGSRRSNISATEKLAEAIREHSRRGQAVNTGVPVSRTIGQPRTYGSTHERSNVKTREQPNINKKHSVKLDAQGVLSAYHKGRRDFAQQNFNNLNLQQANLSGGIFHQSKLVKVNLQGANLSGADFGRANLSKAVLRDTNLGRAYLSYTNLEGADLRGADLRHAHLSHANLKGANLCGANLSNAKISKEQLSQAKTNWGTILPNGRRGFW